MSRLSSCETNVATHEVMDDFAVGVRLELGLSRKSFPKRLVVVDFSIDAEDQSAVLVDQGLRAGICSTEGLSARLQVNKTLVDSPTPTIAKRSCTNIASFPT